MKMIIAGASPIGLLFAAILAKGGEEVLLLDLDERIISAINENGLKFEGTGGVQRIPLHASCDLPPQTTATEVLICARTADTEAMIDLISPCVGTRTAVITLQEGIGSLPLLIDRFGVERVFAGSTNLIASVPEPDRVIHTGWGDTKIAPAIWEHSAKAKSLASRLTRCGIKTEAVDNIAGLVWTRTIIQCGLYALSAITQLRNGRMLEIPEAAGLMERVVKEAVRVATESGVALVSNDLVEETCRFAAATADSNSPMLQSLFQGRPSDVESINGAIVNLAAQHGQDAPVNRALLDLVKIIERTRQEV